MPKYLSTDPNAGIVDQGKYLSTNPNDGLALTGPAFEAETGKATDSLRGGFSGATGISESSWYDQPIVGNTAPRDILDPVVGAGKGVINTIAGMGKFFGRPFVGDEPYEAFQRAYAAPNTPAQKAGFQAEQMGEFFAPMTGGPLAQGVRSGLTTAMQGGTPGEAGLSAVADMATRGLTKGASKAFGKMSDIQYDRAFNPTSRALKAKAERVLPKARDMRIRGSLESIGRRAEGESASAGRQLESAYNNASQSGARVDTAGTRSRVAGERAKAVARGIDPATGNPVEVVSNPQTVSALNKVAADLEALGQTDPANLWKYRKGLSEVMAGSDPWNKPVKANFDRLRVMIERDIDKELKAAVPDADKLAAKYAFWQGLENLAKSGAEARTGNQGGLLLGMLGGGGMAAGGFLAGGPAGAVKGAALSAFIAASRSPQWRTTSAVVKNEIAKLLASGRTQDAMARMAAAGLTRGMVDVPKPEDADFERRYKGRTGR